MAHIPAKLLTRLVQLECRMAQRICPDYFIVTMEIPENKLDSLPDGDRIVLDCYRQDGHLVEARQRITSDPKDQGRRCDPGGYLLDVIEELHSSCHFRENPGHCGVCIGTPVART
jgi:hypothetical protein